MTTLTPEDRALRMLAAGDSLNDVTSSTGLSRDEVEKLKRDFPGTNTQTRPAAVPMRVGSGTPIPGVPSPDLSRAISQASPSPVTLVNPTPDQLTIGRLLEQASAHSNGSVRRNAQTIEDKLSALRKQIRDLAADEAAKQKAAADKAAAQAEILEQQLAAAKAKLRGTPAPATATWSEERKAAARASVQRMNVPADCPKCHRTFGHKGAMANHLKHCTGSAA